MGKTPRSGLLWGFLIVQTGLLLLFLYLDVCRNGSGSIPVKYLSILICLAFSIYSFTQGGEGLISGAMALTLGADTFLLLLNQWYALGILLFCAVQGLYLLRIRRAGAGGARWPVRLLLFLLALLITKGLGLLTPLNLLVVFYFTNFLCNTGQSLSLSGPKFRLFSLGLTLFLCCDICVGIFNQPALSSTELHRFAQVGMWLYYLPAQVLIVLSGLPNFCVRGAKDENQ